MIKIEHIAIWVQDIEKLKAFYEKYFEARASAKYVNEKKAFQSYFLTFSSGARLELMQRPDLHAVPKVHAAQEIIGFAHLAVSVGSEMAVNDLTQRLMADGYICLDGPRWTGDGYYESVILDGEGNRIEITV